MNFCARFAINPLDLVESTVIRFITYLSQSAVAPATVRVYLAGVRAWYIANGNPPPLIYTQRVRWCLRALDRQAPSPSRVRPFTCSMLRIVAQHIVYSHQSVVFYSSMLLGYYGCLRASEYLPAPGSRSNLLPTHLRFVNASTPYFLVNIQSSKTAHKGFQLVVGCSGSEVCAVCWLRHLLAIRTLPPHLPLFSLPSGELVTRAALAAFMQQSLRKAGLDHTNISPHSLRAGAATDAAGIGASDVAIQQLGRWRSSAYRAYVRPSNQQRASSAQFLASARAHPSAP